VGIREIKAKARRDLHQAMQVPAYYFSPKTTVPSLCNVRVHNKYEAKGDVQGTSFRFAEVREDSPQLVFWADQVKPEQHAAVMVSSTEGYRLNTVDPRYLQTYNVYVTALTVRELATYLAPDTDAFAYGEIVLPYME
jgi:hypothetical protein